MKYIKHYMYFLAAIMLQSLNMVAADDEVIENYDSELEVGIIYVSDDSFRSGQYTGLEEEGFCLPRDDFVFLKIWPVSFAKIDSKNLTSDLFWSKNEMFLFGILATSLTNRDFFKNLSLCMCLTLTHQPLIS